jgi:hypothetical protein
MMIVLLEILVDLGEMVSCNLDQILKLNNQS